MSIIMSLISNIRGDILKTELCKQKRKTALFIAVKTDQNENRENEAKEVISEEVSVGEPPY